MKILLFSLLASLLFSCSKGGGGSSPTNNRSITAVEIEMNGTYQALLSPVNPKAVQRINGSLTLVREKDEFIADIRLANSAPKNLHTQSIHVGDRCPTEADDINQDGYIDAFEGAQVYKEILIPLDDDLNSQWMGLGTFPASDEYGYYFYSRVASYEKLLADLRTEDINLKDEYTKLGTDKAMNVTNLVVVIKGVPESHPLPETVAGFGRATTHQALPIACGVITKLESVPGTIDTDTTDVPLPQGGTIGGTGGADDGANFPPVEETDTSGDYDSGDL